MSSSFQRNRLCKKPSLGRIADGKPCRVWLFCWVPAFETVQKTSLGYAGGKPNPLNPPYQGDFPLNSPPYQGDFPLNSPLIRGARGVKNDERWVSYTVSFAGTTNIEFLHSLFRRNDKYWVSCTVSNTNGRRI